MPRIAAAPFPYDFPVPGVALFILDMQRDFLEPGGFGASLGNNVAPLAAIVPTVRQLLDAFRYLGLPVIYTREAHRPDLADCPPAKRLRRTPPWRIGNPGPLGRILIAGEPGNAIVPALAPLPDELIFDKPGKGAFYHTALHAALTARGITHLIVAGVTTEGCVQTTLHEATDRGYDCLLVEDATASSVLAFQQATLEMIRAQGALVGWTATAAQVVQALAPALPAPTPGPLRLQGLWQPSAIEPAVTWAPFRDGIEISRLYGDGIEGPAAALLRYQPGASVPWHRHTGYEHVMILAGSQTDQNGVHQAGTMVINPPGSRHSVRSEQGCLALLVWEKPICFESP